MTYRKLRIAWSVFWGLAAVLLIALWVRSYFVLDVFQSRIAEPHRLSVESTRGRLLFQVFEFQQGLFSPSPLGISDYPISNSVKLTKHFAFYVQRTPYHSARMLLPHWSVLISSGIFAIIPWISGRFSLRILLMAATLVAVVLGLIVYAVRN